VTGITDVRGVPPGHRSLITRLLGAYDLAAEAVEPVPGSVVNQNYRVETEGGSRFVRLHATRRDGERIRREHRISGWIRAQGLPAVPPLAAADGETLHRLGGVFMSMYPWVPGRHAARGALTPDEASVLGGLLGRLHRALRDYRDPSLADADGGARWAAEDAVNQLSRVDDLIRYYPAPPEDQLAAQAGIRFQLQLLEDGRTPAPPAAFDDLDRQPCHGDFHDRNVLLGPGNEVEGVVDWEMVALLPPVYELVRALVMLGLDTGNPMVLDAFLDAYRSRVPLPLGLCRRGVEMRWQATLHSTWVYRAVFIEGNRRADGFLAGHAAAVRRFADSAFRESLARRIAG